MEINKEKNGKKALLMGCLYFVVLALINLLTMLIDNQVTPIDLIILLITALPLLINKKIFSLFFGGLGVLFSLYILIAILIVHTNPEINHLSKLPILIGYLFAGMTIIASLLLVYSGTYSTEKNRFSLIE